MLTAVVSKYFVRTGAIWEPQGSGPSNIRFLTGDPAPQRADRPSVAILLGMTGDTRCGSRKPHPSTPELGESVEAVLAENPVRGCWRTAGSHITPVVMVQCIEEGNGGEPFLPRPAWLRPDPLRNRLPNPIVWPCAVEMVDKANLSPEWLLRRVERFAENR